jgi:tRNA dimethylallyltransferase
VKRAIAVVGPTASGKTTLAIALAQKLQSEILSADSMQFYRGMEIGTAAPTAEERKAVQHHFVGFLNLDETMAAGEFERIAREKAMQLLQRKLTPVLVGGSGLYVSAFIDGLFSGPARDPQLRQALRERARLEGNAAMYDALKKIDPDYAAVLANENDLVRIIRALEVYELSGRPYSVWHQEHQSNKDRWHVTQVALQWEREILYERINQRVRQMMHAGWIEETQRLLDSGHGAQIERLKALGYREIVSMIQGHTTLEEVIETISKQHRRFAKRQLSWFRADKRVHWLRCAEEPKLDDLTEQTLRLFHEEV